MTTDTTESPPRSLGRYELVQPLGQGGMGEVFLAKISGAAGFEKPCIVKTILPALLKDRQFLDRFHHEAKVLVHLVHSSIAQVYDMGEAHGTYYMALEYVAGVDVSYLAEQARVQGQAIPVPVALYLCQKVAEGLGYAHRKAGPDGTPLGIVHRDVSPHNVMVSYEGEVKVIDFGLAKSAARSKYTLPATVMGKLGYMSPEQARAEPLDHRSDIYSCGVMLWELLAGQPLVAHGTVGEMMAAMANPRVPSLHALRPEVTPTIDAVVQRALAPRPEDRYARSDDFARALNEQLLRSSNSLGAEEVGTFIRTLCPEAFSSQRKLISRISGVRRAGSTPPGAGVLQVGVSPLPAGVQERGELDSTAMRPLAQPQDEALGATLRPMVTPMPGTMAPVRKSAPVPTAELAPVTRQSGPVEAASKLSGSALMGIAVILLVMIIGTAGATVFFMRREGPPPPLGMGDPNRFPPPPPDGRFPPPPDGRGPPPPDGRGPPPPDGRGPPPGPEAQAEPPAVEVRPEPSKTPATPLALPMVQTSRVASVVSQGSVSLAVLGRGQGLKKDMEVMVVSAPRPDGMRQMLGHAKVLGRGRVSKVPGMLLELDESAKAAPAPLFIVIPAGSRAASEPVATAPTPEPAPAPAPAPVPAPAPAPPAPPAGPRTLALGVRRQGMLGGSYQISSAESAALGNCTATIERRQQASIPRLIKRGHRLSSSDFQTNPNAPLLRPGLMLIQCDEGQKEAQIQE